MLFQNPGEKTTAQTITYSQFLTSVPHVRDVTIRGDELTGHDVQNRAFAVTLPHDPAIATHLAEKGISVAIGPAADGQNWLTTLLINGLPLIGYYFLVSWPLFRMARALEAFAVRRTARGNDA